MSAAETASMSLVRHLKNSDNRRGNSCGWVEESRVVSLKCNYETAFQDYLADKALTSYLAPM